MPPSTPDQLANTRALQDLNHNLKKMIKLLDALNANVVIVGQLEREFLRRLQEQDRLKFPYAPTPGTPDWYLMMGEPIPEVDRNEVKLSVDEALPPLPKEAADGLRKMGIPDILIHKESNDGEH